MRLRRDDVTLGDEMCLLSNSRTRKKCDIEDANHAIEFRILGWSTNCDILDGLEVS